jgi:hypothetical protein
MYKSLAIYLCQRKGIQPMAANKKILLGWLKIPYAVYFSAFRHDKLKFVLIYFPAGPFVFSGRITEKYKE